MRSYVGFVRLVVNFLFVVAFVVSTELSAQNQQPTPTPMMVCPDIIEMVGNPYNYRTNANASKIYGSDYNTHHVSYMYDEPGTGQWAHFKTTPVTKIQPSQVAAQGVGKAMTALPFYDNSVLFFSENGDIVLAYKNALYNFTGRFSLGVYLRDKGAKVVAAGYKRTLATNNPPAGSTVPTLVTDKREVIEFSQTLFTDQVNPTTGITSVVFNPNATDGLRKDHVFKVPTTITSYSGALVGNFYSGTGIMYNGTSLSKQGQVLTGLYRTDGTPAIHSTAPGAGDSQNIIGGVAIPPSSNPANNQTATDAYFTKLYGNYYELIVAASSGVVTYPSISDGIFYSVQKRKIATTTSEYVVLLMKSKLAYSSPSSYVAFESVGKLHVSCYSTAP